jgi:hypothetical protein
MLTYCWQSSGPIWAVLPRLAARQRCESVGDVVAEHGPQDVKTASGQGKDGFGCGFCLRIVSGRTEEQTTRTGTQVVLGTNRCGMPRSGPPSPRRPMIARFCGRFGFAVLGVPLTPTRVDRATGDAAELFGAQHADEPKRGARLTQATRSPPRRASGSEQTGRRAAGGVSGAAKAP